MQLPFTREEFFDLFAAYNGALWPAVVALWLASLMAAVWLKSSRRPRDRWSASAWDTSNKGLGNRSDRLVRIGGSAAFLLGVSADYALPLAGASLTVFELQKSETSSSAGRPLHSPVGR